MRKKLLRCRAGVIQQVQRGQSRLTAYTVMAANGQLAIVTRCRDCAQSPQLRPESDQQAGVKLGFGAWVRKAAAPDQLA